MPNAYMYSSFIFQLLVQQNSNTIMIFNTALSGKASSLSKKHTFMFNRFISYMILKYDNTYPKRSFADMVSLCWRGCLMP